MSLSFGNQLKRVRILQRQLTSTIKKDSTTQAQMNLFGIKYAFTAQPWEYAGKAAWIFVSLPQKLSKEIRTHFKGEEEGWGRLKATARVGGSEWKTAIWFDTKANTYILPLKAEIRKRENVITAKKVKVIVSI